MDNKSKLTLGSLFDGIGGFPYCAALSGIEPVWASEIEPVLPEAAHTEIECVACPCDDCVEEKYVLPV